MYETKAKTKPRQAGFCKKFCEELLWTARSSSIEGHSGIS